MDIARMSTKKLMDVVKKKEHFPNIGIRIGKRNPKIDYYCDKCQRLISRSQYRNGKGLCKPCILTIN